MQDIISAQRYVARLEELTDAKLLLAVFPVVLRIAHVIHRFGNQPVSPAATFRFELTLMGLLLELGRRIVEWTLNNREPRTRELMPGTIMWQGDAYRRRDLSPTRNLNCLFGKIRVRRWLYESSEGLGLSAVFPLELGLGIVAGVATPALADSVARLAADLTQRQLLHVLRERHHVFWGVETLRKVTAAMAEGMKEFQHQAQLSQLLMWLHQAAKTPGPRRVTLGVGRDGIMLPIRGLAKYKEGATATVSVYDRWGKRLGTVYLGQMPEAGQVSLSRELTRLLKDVVLQWTGSQLRLVYITDAGSHPTDYFHQVLCHMIDPHTGRYLSWEWVVDYYHACQYISTLAEAIFGPGRAAHAWASKMRRWLKEKPQGVFRVLRSAGALRSIRGLVGEASDYDGAYGYLRRHAASMDYSTCRRLRVPIGSGVTEAACKIVFTQRLKCAGMKWNIDSRHIVTLRVIALSGVCVWHSVRDAMHRSWLRRHPRTPVPYLPDIVQNAA